MSEFFCLFSALVSCPFGKVAALTASIGDPPPALWALANLCFLAGLSHPQTFFRGICEISKIYVMDDFFTSSKGRRSSRDIMPHYVSMLRGLNVGSHTIVKTADLLKIYFGLGFKDSQGYLQSGNVVFKYDKENTLAIAKKIESSLDRSLGTKILAFIRTRAEMTKLKDGVCFGAREEIRFA